MLRRRASAQFVSIYDFDEGRAGRELSILWFEGPDEQWLDFVCKNRQNAYAGPLYDIAIGPIANDKVYATIGLYESGLLGVV